MQLGWYGDALGLQSRECTAHCSHVSALHIAAHTHAVLMLGRARMTAGQLKLIELTQSDSMAHLLLRLHDCSQCQGTPPPLPPHHIHTHQHPTSPAVVFLNEVNASKQELRYTGIQHCCKGQTSCHQHCSRIRCRSCAGAQLNKGGRVPFQRAASLSLM